MLLSKISCRLSGYIKPPRTLHPLNYFIFTLRGVYCKKIKFEPVEKIVVDLPS